MEVVTKQPSLSSETNMKTAEEEKTDSLLTPKDKELMASASAFTQVLKTR